MNRSSMPLLVSSDWLDRERGAADLRILDASVEIFQRSDGRYDARSGREAYLRAHIPGAQFADVLSDLADTSQDLRFSLLEPEAFATRMEGLGVGDNTRVVIYSSTTPQWATRVWWLLRYYGFRTAAILDGGFKKWQSESRPVNHGVEAVAPTSFTARPDPSCLATKQQVLAGINSRGDNALLDVLSPPHYAGKAGNLYGYARPGHIAGAINFWSEPLVDQETGLFRPADDIRSRAVGALTDLNRPITVYCGGGIAATQAAFALTLAGLRDVKVYNGSLEEWAGDSSLPMKTGEAP